MERDESGSTPSAGSVARSWPVRVAVLCGVSWAWFMLAFPTAADVLLNDTGTSLPEPAYSLAKGLLWLTLAGIPLLWFLAFMKAGRSRRRVAIAVAAVGLACCVIKLILTIGYGEPLVGS